MPDATRDLSGERFGRLTLLERIHVSTGSRRVVGYRCRCDCGRESTPTLNNLRRGLTASCGCTQVKHRQAGSRTYRIWAQMRYRCLNPRSPDFSRYGARGITVDPRWGDYAAFLADMGERPPGKTLDRINNDGPYAPGNCRWASPIEQSANTRGNHRITHAGETLTLTDWSRRTGLGVTTIRERLRRGWEPERALTTPA